jgi:hypothetical protein
MRGSGCGKPVERFVPRGYHGKMHTYKCGNTGVDGFPVLCDKCGEKFDRSEFRREMAECGENIDSDY